MSSSFFSKLLSRLFSIGFPSVLVLFGGLVVMIGVRGLVEANNSKEWARAEGKVIESVVDARSSRSSGNVSDSVAFHANVQYEFAVDGRIFTGQRVAIGDFGSAHRPHAQAIVDRYTKGKPVVVHYVPGNPEECLLEPGISGQTFFVLGFGLVFLLVGAVLGYSLNRRPRASVS